jgi:hypothetical protein
MDAFEAAQAEIARALQSLREGSGEAEEIDDLPPTPEALEAKDREQDIGLKRMYALILLGLLAAQMIVADAVFVAYAWAGVNWKVDGSVMEVWLGATLIEVVGIVLVVTRYLFPRRDLQA